MLPLSCCRYIGNVAIIIKDKVYEIYHSYQHKSYIQYHKAY